MNPAQPTLADALAQLEGERAAHARTRSQYQEELAAARVGLTDPEALEYARFAYGRLPAEGRPAFDAWLQNVKADPAKAPRALSAFFATPPAAAPAPVAPAAAPVTPPPAAPAVPPAFAVPPAAPPPSATGAAPAAQAPGAPSALGPEALDRAYAAMMRGDPGPWNQIRELALAQLAGRR